MLEDIARRLMAVVDEERMRRDLFYLARDPLPFRTLNYRLPGHVLSTLEEADAYIAGELALAGYDVEREAVRVQALRRDFAKPPSAQYAPPLPTDPWYTAHNLYAYRRGTALPNEYIVVLAHKDSQSWIPSPGANDNCAGTVGVLEVARALATYQPRRTLVCLFCNEEHTPWTSITAAERLVNEGRTLVAALNVDSIGAKSDADRAAGRMANVTRYATAEGERLADLFAALNARYGIGLEQSKYETERPGDDDGSFIQAGLPAAVMNIGSLPYADPAYHREEDRPERVDLPNAVLTLRLILAVVAHLDAA